MKNTQNRGSLLDPYFDPKTPIRQNPQKTRKNTYFPQITPNPFWTLFKKHPILKKNKKKIKKNKKKLTCLNSHIFTQRDIS